MSPATPTLISNLDAMAYGTKACYLGAVGRDVELRVQRRIYNVQGINVKRLNWKKTVLRSYFSSQFFFNKSLTKFIENISNIDL